MATGKQRKTLGLIGIAGLTVLSTLVGIPAVIQFKIKNEITESKSNQNASFHSLIELFESNIHFII